MCGLVGRSGCRICEKTDFYGPSDWCAANLSILTRRVRSERWQQMIGMTGEHSLDLPETAFDTDALWFDLPEELVNKLNKMVGLHPMGASL
jgi:kynureninase